MLVNKKGKNKDVFLLMKTLRIEKRLFIENRVVFNFFNLCKILELSFLIKLLKDMINGIVWKIIYS